MKSKDSESRDDPREWEAFDIPLYELGPCSLELWPHYLESFEGRVPEEIDEERWQDALMRDAYRFGPMVTKHREAWMCYQALINWTKEARSVPEDFIDGHDPEGSISAEGAACQCAEWRSRARAKLAWLAESLADPLESGNEKLFADLAKLARQSQMFHAPMGIDENGEARDRIGCSPEEGRIVNAFFALAGYGSSSFEGMPGLGIKRPTAAEIQQFLRAAGAEKSAPDIRKVLKKFRLPLAEGDRGRPRKE